MAFRLKHRSLAKQLRRLVSKELDAAIESLGPDQAAGDIHEARKRIKKVRSIVKLLKGALGSHYEDANEQLRAAGRRLGRTRDAEAMVETLESIKGRYSDVISQAAKQRVASGLRGETRHAGKHADGVAGGAAGILKRVRKTLPREVLHAVDFSSLRKGLAAIHKRSRKIVATLTVESDAAAFHEWRRRVKEHWYHVRLFAGLHPGSRSRARSLRSLERELGEEHNLALLSQSLLESPGRFGDARTTDLVLGCIQKRQRALRKKALARGRRLFVARPKKVEATVTEWWKGRP